MTQNIERDARTEQPPGTVAAQQQTAPKWWRRPWIIPLALVVLGFLIWNLSPFRELNEATTPLPPHADYPLYWTSLLAHIGFGIITMFCVVLQVWPWLRRNHPRVHRVSGRIYFVCALISGVLALSIVRFAPVVGQIGVSLATISWMFFTTMGFIRARQGRYGEHRRFMLYSFAIVMNNVWGLLIVKAGLALPTPIDIPYLIEAARWVGWVGNLMLVQWWLYHTDKRPVPMPV